MVTINSERETITDNAEKAIIALMNDSLQIEYECQINYPRLLERLATVYSNEDKRLFTDIKMFTNIKKCNEESLNHFKENQNVVKKLGGKPRWHHRDYYKKTDDILKHMKILQQLEMDTLGTLLTVNKIIRFLEQQFSSDSETDERIVRFTGMKEGIELQIIDEKNHVGIIEESIEKLRITLED